MTGPLLVPAAPDVVVTVTGRLDHECPHKDEHDTGTVTIGWTSAAATLELHALRDYLDGFTRERVSHEELTRRIYLELAVLNGISDVSVTSEWDTAGFRVRVDGALLR